MNNKNKAQQYLNQYILNGNVARKSYLQSKEELVMTRHSLGRGLNMCLVQPIDEVKNILEKASAAEVVSVKWSA